MEPLEAEADRVEDEEVVEERKLLLETGIMSTKEEDRRVRWMMWVDRRWRVISVV